MQARAGRRRARAARARRPRRGSGALTRAPSSGSASLAQLDDPELRRRAAGRESTTWTASSAPSATRAVSAAGSVAETLITTRSPGSAARAGRAKRAMLELAAVAVRDEQAHLVAGQAAGLGRRARLEALGQIEGQGAHRALARGQRRLSARRRARGRSARCGRSPSISASRPGHARSGGGRSEMSSPGERVLVHLRAHVAGVDGVDAQVGMLGGEDGAELLERRLRRAVAAPALVGLNGGVGGDVEDARARAQTRQCELHERERGEHVDPVDLPRVRQRVVAPARAAGWARARWRC